MMEQAGISRGTAVSLLLGVLVYGPVINLFFAIGEEIGWRGFLYPALRQRMSTLPACLLVGAIWGLWHTPINLMGHNYGTSYPGFPWLGILGRRVLCPQKQGRRYGKYSVSPQRKPDPDNGLRYDTLNPDRRTKWPVLKTADFTAFSCQVE